ncbi:MAG: HAMP domain-containing histidine kinase [Lachnospiraceae bacterium]|jgi:signal transduction histidine kinase|nr:HAMP domain-containing histidine kinase [Lachnospiraceae bacterium]
MKRTFFDRVIVIIVIVLIIVFVSLAGYTTYETQQALVREKQLTLGNEALLLSEQSIAPYIAKVTTKDDLQVSLNEFEDALKCNVWYYDRDGKLIAASYKDKNEKIPENIRDLDMMLTVDQGFTMTGKFYGIFDSTMISVGVPIKVYGKLQGFLLLHTSISEMDDIRKEMLGIMYMPFVVILLFIGLVLFYLSGSVLRPIKMLNNVAREYAKGNFDAKTGVSRDDEIGELAESLEYMADELSKLDEYRKNFIANISHDFRSPLTSIKGYIQAMIDGTIPPEKYGRYLLVVLNESKRLTKLTEGLLELNNFDTYGPVLSCSNFDVVDVIRLTRSTVEVQCEKKNIDFRIDCPAEYTEVYADRMKIGQVIFNLVDNAIKFSPENGKLLATITNKNDKVIVSIKDQGPGIEKENQNKIWDRFYKTDASRGKDKQGTGLGLAITKEIIKAHGEYIDLISSEGKGCEFIFSLPFAKEVTNE